MDPLINTSLSRRVPHATVAKDAKDEDAEKASRNGRGSATCQLPEGFYAFRVLCDAVRLYLFCFKWICIVDSYDKSPLALKMNSLKSSSMLRSRCIIASGLLESVYEVILAYELRKAGVQVERQVPISIHYDELIFDEGFRADLVVEGTVIVELKSVEQLAKVHSKQVLTQLRLSGRKLGLLINFSEAHLRHGIERIVDGLAE